jgi:hypothetical protein
MGGSERLSLYVFSCFNVLAILKLSFLPLSIILNREMDSYYFVLPSAGLLCPGDYWTYEEG